MPDAAVYVESAECLLICVSARNGQVYTGIPYRNFFLYLNFISELISIYYIYLIFPFSDVISLFRF
jgi:hypothetical protein